MTLLHEPAGRRGTRPTWGRRPVPGDPTVDVEIDGVSRHACPRARRSCGQPPRPASMFRSCVPPRL